MTDSDAILNDDDLVAALNTDQRPPTTTVDFERYKHLMDDFDMSEEQKREYLQALWNIVSEFVALGWGVHPVQQAQDARERDSDRQRSPRNARRTRGAEEDKA